MQLLLDGKVSKLSNMWLAIVSHSDTEGKNSDPSLNFAYNIM